MTQEFSRRQLLQTIVLGATQVPRYVDAEKIQKQTLKVAAYPLVDEIIASALPLWTRMHPEVKVEIVRRNYLDHHTAMTTALSTSSHLPDVMTLESSFVGRYSQGSGLEDLSKAPFNLEQYKNRFVPYAFDQVVNQKTEMIAVPTDIGPGTMLYRHDICKRARVKESELLLVKCKSSPLKNIEF